MKKRNLLTLGALVLSLGLTVTSCAGAQGDKGDKGDTGAKGDKGDKGDKGEKGDTYLAIIVDEWKFTDVKVTQDKYFVEPGETVTFTFEAMENNAVVKTGEILSKLEFNGESVLSDVIVADENGKATYTLTTAKDAKGYQMTEAEFGSALTLEQAEFTDWWKTLVASDNQIGATVNTLGVTTAQAPSGEWASISPAGINSGEGLEKVAKTAYDTIEAKDVANKTAKEKLEIYKEAVTAAKKTVQDAYDAKISALKTSALASLESEVKEESNYSLLKSADVTSLLASAKADLDACKTIQEIAEFVDKTGHTSGTSTAKGSWNVLFDRKNTAIGELKTAMTGLISDYDGTSTTASANTDFNKDGSFSSTLKSTLESYDVDLTNSPKSIFDSYVSTISAATSIELESGKTSTVLGTEGATKIKNSISTIKSAVAENIKQSYIDEINNATSLSGLDDTKTALRSAVETVVSNFLYTDTAGTRKVSDYIGTDAFNSSSSTATSLTDLDYSKSGLVGSLEFVLGKTIDSKGVLKFAAERITNAKTKALADFKAKLDVVLKDTEYVEATKVTKDGQTNLMNKNMGSTSASVDNPFAASTETAHAGSTTLVESDLAVWSGAAATTVYNASTITYNSNGYSNAVTYSAQAQYDSLAAVEAGSDKILNSVSSVKTWEALHLNDFDNIYKAAKKAYADKQRTTNITLAGGTYITASGVQAIYDEKVYVSKNNSNAVLDTVSCGDITTYATNVKGNITTLTALDTKVKAFYDTKKTDASGADAAVDTKWATAFGADASGLASSTLASADAVESLISGLLDGSKTSSDVTALSMADLYKSDVATYLANTKQWLEDNYKATYSETKSTEKGLALKAAYEDFISLIGHKVTTDGSKASGYKVDNNGTVDLKGDTFDSIATIQSTWVTVVEGLELTGDGE